MSSSSNNTTVTSGSPSPSSSRISSSSSVAITSSSAPAVSTTPSVSSSSSSVAVTSSSTAGVSSSLDTTSTVSAATTVPTSTRLVTSIITQSSSGGSSIAPVTVVVTSEINPTTTSNAGTSTLSSSTSSSTAASLQNNGSSSGSGGLSTPGKTAIAVVVPVVAVALLVLAALFFWRKRKQRKSAEEARRAEVEEYGYNPNNNPTLPAVVADGRSEMTEEPGSGYRGWGVGAIAGSNRKASTTLSGGHTRGLSDAGSGQGGLSTSPTAFGSDGQNSDTHKNRDTMTSDDLAALGAAPAAGANRNEMRRGPSNASSSYSAGHHSSSDPNEHTGDVDIPEAAGSPQHYGYHQSGPYGDGSYGAGEGMPVVRDVSARRNTRIEQGGGYQQGNSGIAQNF